MQKILICVNATECAKTVKNVARCKMTELKACPFCGNNIAPTIINDSDSSCRNFAVVCSVNELTTIPMANWKTGCGAMCGYQRTKEQTIEAWNRREREKE